MKYAVLLVVLAAVSLHACGKPDEASAPVSPPPAADIPPPTAVTAAPAVEAPVAPEAPAAPPPAATAPAAQARPAPSSPPAGEAAPAAATPDAARGQQTYRQACAFCHDKGVAGAPMIGDGAAWGPRLAQGREALYASALRGKGAMPAKGGNPSLAEADVKAAVDHLAAQAR